jgi:hypothetical protein
MAAALALGGLGAGGAWAQTDEIQVYNAEIAKPGVFNLTLHNNYTPDGAKTPAFPGAVVSNHALNGVPEWAYGVAPWLEAGLYLPLYSFPAHGGPDYNGFKLRTLFVEPNAAQHAFFYGMNFEFSFNQKQWDPHTYSSEIRPILGWRFGKLDFIFNPILDNSWTGVRHLDFAPESRLDYNINDTWAIAAEEYDDLGELYRFQPGAKQTHQLFSVVDYSGRGGLWPDPSHRQADLEADPVARSELGCAPMSSLVNAFG